MSGKTNIGWTDWSWNPSVGCTRVSAGCDACYAYQLHDQRHEAWKAGRFPDAPPQYHRPFSEVQVLPQRLEDPLRWRKPRRVFVNSVSDLFHTDVPTEFIDQVFGVITGARRHTFQILTKRPQRMMRYLLDPETKRRIWNAGRPIIERVLQRDLYDVVPIPVEGRAKGTDWCYPEDWPLPNVWLGTSVENQEAAFRIAYLVQTPAAVRFLSCEPLIGPLDLLDVRLNSFAHVNPLTGRLTAMSGRDEGASPHRVHWVIVGGESGPEFRPLDLDWVRAIRDQCVSADVPLFFKQGSGRFPGKHRELDGRTWDEMPAVAS